MNNLYRELAPIPGPAWAEIEEDEARRTFKRNIAGRRIVDVEGPTGFETSAVTTGHIRDVQSETSGLQVKQRIVQEYIELRTPFTVPRQAIDDVARGSGDSDWQPVKDAATTIAMAEDRAILHGSMRPGSAESFPAARMPQWPSPTPSRTSRTPSPRR